MSIIKNENGSISIQYRIPDEYTSKIDNNFVIIFCKELNEIKWHWHKHESAFPQDMIMVESTYSWTTALKCTCLRTNNEDLWEYYKCLAWYNKDLFDGELTELCYKILYGDKWEAKYQEALDYWYPQEEREEK